MTEDTAQTSFGKLCGSGPIPGLDGLRALCILMVMLSHSGLDKIVPGVLGVTVFFFISGFLITTLLLREQRDHGGIAIGAFYMRRMLRLYPPLLVFIAVSAVIWVTTGNRLNPLGVAGALAYFGNYVAIFDMPALAAFGGHLWSLAVEEHFYLFYPLLLVALLARPRLAVPVMLALCAAALAFRVHVTLTRPDLATDYAGMATECRIDGVLFGALTALTLASPEGEGFLRRITSWPAIVAALVVLLASLLIRDGVFRSTLRYTVQELALPPLVLAGTMSVRFGLLRRVLNSPVLVHIGQRSYALYLWHLSVLAIAEVLLPGAGWVFVAAMVLGWVISFAIAEASYRYVEMPVFSMRRRFGSGISR